METEPLLSRPVRRRARAWWLVAGVLAATLALGASRPRGPSRLVALSPEPPSEQEPAYRDDEEFM